MSLDTTATVVGELVDAAAINSRLVENVKWPRGIQSGQTEVDLALPVTVEGDMRFSGANPSLRKQFLAAAGGGSFHFGAKSQAGILLQNGDKFRLALGVGEVDSNTEEILKNILVTRVSEGSGFLTLGAGLQMNEDGEVGVNGAPEAGYALRVHGTLNASGSLRRLEQPLQTWTDNSGDAEFSGTAKAVGFNSTIADGTAPYIVDSTTLCPGVDGALFEGSPWHVPLVHRQNKQVTESDTTVCSLQLDKAGDWRIDLVVSLVGLGNLLSCDIWMNDGTTAIGRTWSPQNIDLDDSPTVRGFGYYTSAAGNETIEVHAQKSGPFGLTIAQSILIARWKGD